MYIPYNCILCVYHSMKCRWNIEKKRKKMPDKVNTVIYQHVLNSQLKQMIAVHLHTHTHTYSIIKQSNIHVIICFHICLWLHPGGANLSACGQSFSFTRAHTHTNTHRYVHTVQHNLYTQALICTQTPCVYSHARSSWQAPVISQGRVH